MGKEICGGGVTSLISFMLSMGLYGRYRNNRIYFVALEMDEDDLRERIHNQFIKNSINKKENGK